MCIIRIFFKKHVFSSPFLKKNSKKSGIYYYENHFLKNFTKGNRLVLNRDLYHRKPLCSADPIHYSVSSYKNIWVPMHQFEWKQLTVQGFLAFQPWIYLVKWPEPEVRGFGSHWFQKKIKFLHFCQKNFFIATTTFLMLQLIYFCWNA